MAEAQREKVVVDVDALTLGDFVEFEERTGLLLADGIDLARLPMKAQAVLLWIYRRQTEPTYTYDDALSVPFGELPEIVIEGVDETGPTPAAVADEAPSAPSATNGSKS